MTENKIDEIKKEFISIIIRKKGDLAKININKLYNNKPMYSGITPEERLVINGEFIFDLKAAHGLPLNFALDYIQDNDYVMDWVSFIEAARKNSWWDYQTHQLIQTALEDSSISRENAKDILDRFKIYVMSHVHPKMTEN